MKVAESSVEQVALEWYQELGYSILYGPTVEPGKELAERDGLGETILTRRLNEALQKLNPDLSIEAQEDALRKVLGHSSPSLVVNNRNFHQMLVNGISVEFRRDDGSIGGTQIKLIDFDNPENNDWLAVNQFTLIEGKHNRRPDVVVFVNGLPLAVIELKNPTDEEADVEAAFRQLQTYKEQIPSLFAFNELSIISDGLQARVGSLTADFERFMPWRTVDGDDIAPPGGLELEVLLKGVFEKERFLDLIRFCIVFQEEQDGVIVKKVAGYHQFHAVRKAVDATIQACAPSGDKRCGVVWHTQGSGKSLTMAFYSGKIVIHPAMENPTLLIITDRNDLDNQLFGTFASCHELLRQTPVQADSRIKLRELLKVASGGVVFTTIQKFFPEEKGDSYPLLSDRRNIIVIADEAHRSQYDFIDGFARHMRDALPNASFIGFTGTPIELTDKNTRAVFGDYISIYDIQRAVEDKATVPIFYESRLAKLELKEEEKPYIDPGFEEVTEGEETQRKEKLKTKWAALEALVGSEKRIGLVAKDLVAHFEKRLETLEGKAMIVCMSRRICVELYEAIRKIRPDWHDNDDAKGQMKIVMTGSASDPLDWQGHIHNKKTREDLANRFKNPKDEFKLVIVRDMWLTGFDAPCLHTMYLDKPMRGHGLMQAIARVNRVFKDKPGGLVVDYLGIATELKQALSTYTESGGSGKAAIDQEEAVAVMLEKYEVCGNLFHGFDWSAWKAGSASTQLKLIPAGQEHILKQEKGKERLLKSVTELTQAFALAVPHSKAIVIRDDVSFFQAIKAALVKTIRTSQQTAEQLEHALKQLVSRAVSSTEVMDVFALAGLKKPDISILSDEFLAEVRDLPHRNLAVELLQKLLKDEVRSKLRKNLVQNRSFLELLERALKKYQSRAIETAQVIEELIALAKDLREASSRGAELGLTEDEVAFYDALEVNDSAVKVLGDATLKQIARDLVVAVRNNIGIDWSIKESVRANLRRHVKRVLLKYGYPPDKQEKAVELVLQQTEMLSEEWA
jgi:type I restriction enzyme R subunit